jgi:hypothetical protein
MMAPEKARGSDLELGEEEVISGRLERRFS